MTSLAAILSRAEEPGFDYIEAQRQRILDIAKRCREGDPGPDLPVHKGVPKGLATMLVEVPLETGGCEGLAFGEGMRVIPWEELPKGRWAATQETPEESLARARRDAEAYVARGGK